MIPVTVTFYGDVGFDRSYNHVIDFTNDTERESYFIPKILKTIENCAYNKPMNSIQIRCNYEEALNFTYCKFIMGSNSSHQKKIFAWVDDVILKTDQTDGNGNYVPILEINIAIDPWQTFLFDFTLGESFVAREHVDRFRANGDGTRGWCLENTSDDKNVGTIKRIKDLVELSSEYTFNVYESTTYIAKFFWIILQRVTTGTNPHVEIYFIPVSITQNTLSAVNSNGYYVLNVTDILNDSFITDIGIPANEISSIHLIPFDIGVPKVVVSGNRSLDFDFYFRNDVLSGVSEISREYLHPEGSQVRQLAYRIVLGVSGKTLEFNRDVVFTESVGLTTPVNNQSYSKDCEPQLYKSPYTRIAIVDEEEIERAYLPDISANVSNGYKGVRLKLLVDTMECRLRVYPLYVVEDNIVITDKQWCEFNLTSIDIISTNWYSYLVQERQATREMLASQVNQQAIANAISGVSGAVGQGGGQAISVGRAQNGQSELGAFAAGGIVGLGVGAINTVGSYVADKHFAFEQQDIREKAIRMKANNVMNNGTFKSSINLTLRLVLMKCDETSLNLKALEFHKYGYSIYKYETPNVKTRKYFNFIATNIVKIEGSLNNNIKMALMNIFNSGVTIWHGDYISELSGIGDYSKENIERSLL